MDRRRPVNWRTEWLGGAVLLLLMTAVSLPSLGFDSSNPLLALGRNFYTVIGGRLADKVPQPGLDPSTRLLLDENMRLNGLLALRGRLSGQTQAALVSRREPELWWSRLEVEFALPPGPPPRGTAMVLTPAGLIGTLESDNLLLTEEVGQTFCRGTVVLLSSADTQLSVVVGSTNAPFLLEGRGGFELTLRPVTSGAEKGLSAGDLVRTSGLGAFYSQGLEIGVVGKDTHRAEFTPMASTPSEVLLWWK